MDAGNNSQMAKSKVPRHTTHQIQQLEAFFTECRNPNMNQRRQLSRELGLGEDQIKFWFQNKRNQTKVQSERADYNSLRSENEALKYENQAYSEILKYATCPTCDDVSEEERKLNIEKLRRENSQKREEYERIANEITRKTGKPIAHLLSLPPESLDRLLNLSAENYLGQQSRSSYIPGIDEEGRRSVLALSHRMIREFCAILSIPDRPHLSESATHMVKISVQDGNEAGQSHGIFLSASTSIWLPLSFEYLFDFLRDEHRRPEWDVLLKGGPIYSIASMATGAHPGNSVQIIQPYRFNKHMLLLQENSIDPQGALVVFAPVDKQTFISVMQGEDSSQIPILPCGFLISNVGTPNGERSDGASTSMGIAGRPFGSLLTLTFQLAVAGVSKYAQNHKAAANSLNTLVISTIQKLKGALGCTED